MNTQELEALLDGAEETDVLEFKGAMTWNLSLIRDILAMANVQDGGRIVIGVADETYEREGLSDEQIASFDQETVRDRVSEFADPRVELRIQNVMDEQGLAFVVIEIGPFDTIPVICKRDGADVRRGDIYYRSRSGRAASARVRDSADMRDIIEVAIVRSQRRLARVGLRAGAVAGYDYEAEIGDL